MKPMTEQQILDAITDAAKAVADRFAAQNQPPEKSPKPPAKPTTP
jgi:hypothetical protein